MLAANSGFDFKDFAAFVVCIMQKRLKAAQQWAHGQQLQMAPSACQEPQQQQQQLGPWDSKLQHLHIAFDLQRAAHVLKLVQSTAQDAAARNSAWMVKQRKAGLLGSSTAGQLVGQHSSLHCPQTNGTGGVCAQSNLPSCLRQLEPLLREAKRAVDLLLG